MHVEEIAFLVLTDRCPDLAVDGFPFFDLLWVDTESYQYEEALVSGERGHSSAQLLAIVSIQSLQSHPDIRFIAEKVR